jgi:hypothetical protein
MTVTRPLEGDAPEALHVDVGAPFATTASDGELVGIVTAGRAHVRSGLMRATWASATTSTSAAISRFAKTR